MDRPPRRAASHGGAPRTARVRAPVRAVAAATPFLTLGLTLSLALGACSPAAPETGVVATVSTGATSSRPAEPPSTAKPPVKGLGPVEAARGFMQAMSSMDAEVAQAWVVADPAAQAAVRGWADHGEVYVYDHYDVVTSEPDPTGGQTVTISARHLGTLEGDQWHPAAAVEPFGLTLLRQDGEWRVANPPGTPWITSADFMDLYERAMVFMVAPDGKHLAPQPVFLRKPTTTATGTNQEDPPSGRDDRSVVRTALDRVLGGPTDAGALTTAIPPGARVLDVQVADATVRVDLSQEFAAPGGGPGLLRVGQIVWTVTTLMRTHEVELIVQGQPPGQIGADRFDAGGRWRANAEPLAGLLPTRGGSTDQVLFTRGGQIHTVPVAGGEHRIRPLTFRSGPAGAHAAPTWSPQADQIAFLVGHDRAEQLWVGSADGGNAHATHLAGDLSAPSWTPDGSRLLVLRHDPAVTTLWSVHASSGTIQPLQLAPLPRPGLVPTTIAVSPDGAAVVAVGGADPAQGGRGGELFTGQLTPAGVTAWTPLALAPAGAAHSPVWVEPAAVAFVVNSGSLGDEGTLWTVDKDGWNPQEAELGSERPGELANQLSGSPDGDRLVFTVRSDPGTNQIFTIRRRGENTLPQPLTGPDAFASDADPNLASR